MTIKSRRALGPPSGLLGILSYVQKWHEYEADHHSCAIIAKARNTGALLPLTIQLHGIVLECKDNLTFCP
jgi:hypothetical protein